MSLEGEGDSPAQLSIPLLHFPRSQSRGIFFEPLGSGSSTSHNRPNRPPAVQKVDNLSGGQRYSPFKRQIISVQLVLGIQPTLIATRNVKRSESYLRGGCIVRLGDVYSHNRPVPPHQFQNLSPQICCIFGTEFRSQNSKLNLQPILSRLLLN